MKEPKQNLIITKKLKGEDGHKTFSIRIKDETVERLDDIAKRTNRSRNDLINMLLDYAMDYCEIHDGQDDWYLNTKDKVATFSLKFIYKEITLASAGVILCLYVNYSSRKRPTKWIEIKNYTPLREQSFLNLYSKCFNDRKHIVKTQYGVAKTNDSWKSHPYCKK